MNVKEMAQCIGQRGLLNITNTEIRIPVVILNVRQTFGRIDYQVTPIGGDGETWVQSNRVKLCTTQITDDGAVKLVPIDPRILNLIPSQ